MQWKEIKYANTRDPNVWGPPFWFTLHNGAIHLPANLGNDAHEVQGFIRGLPKFLPCVACKKHARHFIQTHKNEIDNLTSRSQVFNLLVDFHNYVNKNTGKSEMSYEDAYKMYSQQATVNTLTYQN